MDGAGGGGGGGGDDNTTLRVASFSCYLDSAKDNLLHKISAQHYPPISKDTLTNLRVDSFSYLNPPHDKFVFNIPPPHEVPRKNGEISVFGADKYFSMKLEYPVKPVNLTRTTSDHGLSSRSQCSETSSLKTQTAFLQALQRNGSQTKPKRAICRRIFSGFGCKGPCFERKDVHVEANTGSDPGSKRGDHVPEKPKEEVVTSMEESRTSIEVFGGGKEVIKGDVAKDMERKLSMLTWDAIPKAKGIPTAGSATVFDDMASEASSDLFEIENISASMMQLANDDLSMSPSSHYAPSEASIQWSVVTASAADYPVFADYHDDPVSGKATRHRDEKEVQKSRNGGLLGCRSLKTVDVAENVKVSRKTNEKAKHHHRLKEFSFSITNAQ